MCIMNEALSSVPLVIVMPWSFQGALLSGQALVEYDTIP